MSDTENANDHSRSDTSRRSILKKGALSSVALGLGGSAIGTAAAQVDENQGTDEDPGADQPFNEDELFVESEAYKALQFRGAFRPNVPFTIVSPIIDFQPDVEEIQDNIWSEYNTRIIRYLDNDRHVLFFPAHSAEIGPFDEDLGFVVDDEFYEAGAFEDDELVAAELTEDVESLEEVGPQIFVMDLDVGVFGDSEVIVTVQFSEIREKSEEEVIDAYGPFDFNPTPPSSNTPT